jgi:hypothetical protein
MFFLRASGFVLLASSLYGAASCESLKSLALDHATMTLAETVAAGTFDPPPTRAPLFGEFRDFNKLPSFCRVAATLRPSADSEIKIEVWMPVEGWNGKFQAIGNGGWNGGISRGAMGEALVRGYTWRHGSHSCRRVPRRRARRRQWHAGEAHCHWRAGNFTLQPQSPARKLGAGFTEAPVSPK